MPVVIELGTPWFAAVPEAFHIFVLLVVPDPWQPAHELAEYKACPFNGLMAANALCSPVSPVSAIAIEPMKDKTCELVN
jgi:hypothetical protein